MISKQVHLSEITVDTEIQPRDQLNQAKIDEYAECYADGIAMPEIQVHEIDDELFLCDGFTRYAAMQQAGVQVASVLIRERSTRGALLVEAVRANSKHGQPLTANEKRRAACKIMDSFVQSGVHFTQQQIADLSGCSQSTICRMMQSRQVPPPAKPYLPIKEAVDIEEDKRKAEAKELAAKRKEIASRPPGDRINLDIKECRVHVNELIRAMKQVTASLQSLEGLPTAEIITNNMAMLSRAKNDIYLIMGMSPSQVCPKCEGHKCAICDDRGWISVAKAKILSK